MIRDLRYVQVACKQSVPKNLETVDWQSLVKKGKEMVTSTSELSCDSDVEEDEDDRKKRSKVSKSVCGDEENTSGNSHALQKSRVSYLQAQPHNTLGVDPFWQM